MIGFNKPYITGSEFGHIQEAIKIQKLSGNGYFTKRCHEFFEKRYGFKKVLLTHSCTAALEMAALLLNLEVGDEVILPSYTFVSTANPFLMRGATIVFADSSQSNPNLSVQHLRSLITKKTKAVVVVHYAGVACDMDPIMQLAGEHGFFIIEDAAQGIDSYYKGKPLGSIGHLAAFSFHETKNIISGEGGLLVINDDKFLERSEIIWEKGTNRAAFSRREVSKYSWVDVGSSFLPSEITAAFLYAQLEHIDEIQKKRKAIWNYYYKKIIDCGIKHLQLPFVNEFATDNGHIFYLVTRNLQERDALIKHLHNVGIQAIFHYVPLHLSPFFLSAHNLVCLPFSEYYGNGLLRLPLFVELTFAEVDFIADAVGSFYKIS